MNDSLLSMRIVKSRYINFIMPKESFREKSMNEQAIYSIYVFVRVYVNLP